jgi:hypothetical protein
MDMLQEAVKMRIWRYLTVGVCLAGPVLALAEEGTVPDPQWQVARAQFTSGIENREPVDRLVVATPMIREVYFFTDLRHLGGRTVTHRWKYQGNVVSLVPFKVGGPRWRVNSKKEIEPGQVGEWSVTVVDESGWPLYTELFRYEEGAPLLQPADNPVVGDAAGAMPETDRAGGDLSMMPQSETRLPEQLPATGPVPDQNTSP